MTANTTNPNATDRTNNRLAKQTGANAANITAADILALASYEADHADYNATFYAGQCIDLHANAYRLGRLDALGILKSSRLPEYHYDDHDRCVAYLSAKGAKLLTYFARAGRASPRMLERGDLQMFLENAETVWTSICEQEARQ